MEQIINVQRILIETQNSIITELKNSNKSFKDTPLELYLEKIKEIETELKSLA